MIRKAINFITLLCLFAFADKSQASGMFEILRIYPTDGGSVHYYGKPYTGLFTSANGEFHDASEYYQSNSSELHLKGIALLTPSESQFIKFNWILDFGYHSELYSVATSLMTDISYIILEKNTTYTFGLKNAIMLGGRIKESPCVDSLSREFHCGTGLPWTDYSDINLKPSLNAFFMMTINF
jgi:hypothetical protein